MMAPVAFAKRRRIKNHLLIRWHASDGILHYDLYLSSGGRLGEYLATVFNLQLSTQLPVSSHLSSSQLIMPTWKQVDSATPPCVRGIYFSNLNYCLCVLNPIVQMSDDVDLYQKMGMSMSTFLNKTGRLEIFVI